MHANFNSSHNLQPELKCTEFSHLKISRTLTVVTKNVTKMSQKLVSQEMTVATKNSAPSLGQCQ